jgi:F0F1-type ATP synthase membrane subunit c/vacuolar-type H+-ATPase subunit K
MNPAATLLLKEKYQRTLPIAYSLIGGCFMFIVVSLFMGVHPDDIKAVNQVGMFRFMDWMFGFTGLAASFVIKNVFLKVSEFNNENAAIERLVTSFFVSFALCEGPVLFGLIVFYLSKNPIDLVLPVLIGAIGFTAHFPRYDQWENWLNNVTIKK